MAGVLLLFFSDSQPSAHTFIPQQEYARKCFCKCWFSQLKSSILVLGFTAAHSYNYKEIPNQLYAELDRCKWHLSKFWHWISGKSLSSECTNDGDKSCIFVLVACCSVIASLGCRSCACLRFWVLMCQFFDMGKASSECDCIFFGWNNNKKETIIKKYLLPIQTRLQASTWAVKVCAKL